MGYNRIGCSDVVGTGVYAKGNKMLLNYTIVEIIFAVMEQVYMNIFVST